MNAFTKFTKEELIELLKSSESITDVLRKVHLSTNGSGTRTSLEKVCRELEIFNLYLELKNKGRHSYKQESHPVLSLEEMLTENSFVSRNQLKKRLLKEGLLKNICSECGLSDLWNGKEIKMILDHINGINNDNRIENLRMLCPNCNSQQSTFAGRNAKKIKNCRLCGKEVYGKTIYCSTECRTAISKINKEKSIENINNRFWSKVDIRGKDDCWNWTFAIDTGGYGGFRYNGKKYGSNKMAWILTYGEIKNDSWVSHICKNKKCCNPSHLYLLTRSERMKMAVKEGSAGILRIKRGVVPRGEKNHSHILLDENIPVIRKLINSGVNLSKIATEFKVHRQTILDIKNNKTWKHVQ